MNSQELRAIQAPFKERYQTEPETAKQTLTATGRIEFDTISVQLDRPGPAWERSGLHPLAGGDGTSACAAEMLLNALAGCAGVTFAAVKTAMEVPVTSTTIRVEGDLDFRGTLGVARGIPVGYEAIRVHFDIESDAPDSKLAKLTELAERYCVVAQSLQNVSASWSRVGAGNAS